MDDPYPELQNLLESHGDQDRYAAELRSIQELGGWFAVPGDVGWPMNDHCLGVLRGVGRIPPGPRIGVIGARRADTYGLEIAGRLARVIVDSGACVVSGGAFGVDIAAHRAALSHGGNTIAVVGGGLSNLAPASHGPDFRRITSQGAVVSPLPCSQSSARWTFPFRNPWIAGLCKTLLVVQAGLKSGALQTARAALEQGVEVWVVPGALDHPLHKGCHQLVSEGAKLMVDETSWLGDEGVIETGQLRLPSVGVAEPKEAIEVWRAIGSEPMTMDEISQSTGKDLKTLAGEITTLELSGWLRRGPAGGFMRACPEQA